MATIRETPYHVFNFLISFGNGQEAETVGGFAEASGMGVDVNYAEYRNGNEPFNTVRKVAGTYSNDDITLKRGLIGSTDVFEWLKNVATGAHEPRLVTITLLDEAREPVASWELRNAQPKKWTGPSLSAKGGGDLAMEEIVLVCEDCTYR